MEVEQDALMERMVNWIVEGRLVAPAIFAVEAMMPLALVVGSALTFASPYLESWSDKTPWQGYANLLGDRSLLSELLRRLLSQEDKGKPK